MGLQLHSNCRAIPSTSNARRRKLRQIRVHRIRSSFQGSSPLTQDFLVTLVFGAVVIVVFSRDQFRRPSYPKSQELERLIEFLEPPDLRNGRVYWFAAAVYTSILLAIYFLLCIYGTVPVLQTLGLTGLEESETVLVPSIPLGVSLAVVGLAPGIPILQRFEEKIRFAAHHLSGIPTWLLHGCRILKNRPIGLPSRGPGFLIPERDWKRLAHYRSHGTAMLDDPDSCVENVTKILVYRSWILKERMNSTLRMPRAAILRKEEDIEERIERMILSLDSLSGFHNGTQPQRPNELTRDSWASLAKEVDELCARICGLLMLQVEHGLISTRHAKLAGAPHAHDGAVAQTSAQCLLNQFLAGAEIFGRESELVGRLWGRAVTAAAVTAFIWALALGAFWDSWYPALDVVVLPTAFEYALSAILLYAPAIFVALTLQGRKLWNEGDTERWPSMVSGGWLSCSWPVVVVFLASTAAALIPIVALNLYSSFTQAKIEFAFDEITIRFWPGLESAFITELPRATLAPILAIGVVASVDAWRASERGMPNRSGTVLACFVALMAFWTPIVTLLTAQWQSSLGCDQATSCDVASLGTLFVTQRLDLALGSIRSALIGLIVLQACQRTLAKSGSNVIGSIRRESKPHRPIFAKE